MNTRRWTPPDFGDLRAVAAALDAACPAAAPVRELRVLGEGFFSVALASASGYVFRLGTSPDVITRYRKEWTVLPWLATKGLPAAIPEPSCLIEAGEAFPFGGIGYPMLAGRGLLPAVLARADRRALARQIARFTIALHHLPVSEGRAVGLPEGRDVDRRWLEAYRDSSVDALSDVLHRAEHSTLVRWWEAALSDRRMTDYEPVVVHGDVGDENLLVDGGGKLAGVIDFEHAAVGDPVHDFRQLRFLGESFMEQVIAAYVRLGGEIDAGFRYRLERERQFAAFGAIHRAWGRGEQAPIERAPARLRALGVV